MGIFKDTLMLIDKVSAPLKKINDATEKVQKSTDKLEKKYKGIVVPMRNFEAGILKIDRKLRDAQNQMEKFAKKTEHIKKLGNNIQSVGNKMTVGLTLPIVALGGASVKAAADMEAMQQQLSTMLQSEEKGAKMFDDIKKMASKTPFGTKDLMSATNTMLGFGIAEEKVLPLMQQLGDISGGNAQRFQSLALAFSQVSSAGKLQGQDLLQMINAGFNPLEAIAKRTGKTVGYWKEQMSKGAVTVEMVEQAMKDATSEGGRFFNMMEKQSKTALGQWSTMQDNLNQVLADFGKQIMPFAIKALQAFSGLLEKFNKLSPGLKKFIVILGGIIAIIGPLVSLIGTVITVIGGLNTALLFLSANPIVLTIIAWTTAISAVIAIIILLVKNWNKIKEVAINVCKAVANAWSSLVNKFKEWINKLVGWLDTLLEKLGVLAYLMPGLGQIKLAKDIGTAIGNKISSIRQSQTNNTSNTTNNVNNYYGNSTPQPRYVGGGLYVYN